MMRVTNSIIYQNFLAQLQRLNVSFAEANERVTTGKRINRPSDDPVDSTILTAINSEIASVTQFVENIDNANRRLESSDARLNDVVLNMTRVYQLNEQGANEPNVDIPRKGIAEEIYTLTQEILDHADASVGGRLLFAGTRTTVDSLKQITGNPEGRVYSVAGLAVTDNGSAATISGTVPDVRFFNEHIYQLRVTDGAGGYEIIDLDANDTVIDSGTLAGPPDTITVAGMEITFSAGALAQGDVFTILPQYAYNGTEDDIGMQVDENNIFTQNVKGTDPFGGAEPTGTAQNPGGTIFDDLVELRRALLTDDQPAIQTSLNTVSGQIDNLTQVRANVGGRISNLRNLQTRSQTELTDLLIEVSKIENANLPEAITQLIQTQSGLQAALQAGARIGQLNLFDVLG